MNPDDASMKTDADRRRRARTTALVMGAVALAVFIGFFVVVTR